MRTALTRTGGLVALWIAAGALLAAAGPPPARADAPADVAVAIEALLAGPSPAARDEPIDLAALRRAYAPGGFRPLWLSRADAGERRRHLLAALRGAVAHGIDDEGLHLALLDGPAGAAPLRAAELDVLLTDAFLRYAARAHPGPEAAPGPHWAIAPDPLDPVAALLAADRAEGLATLLGGLLPTAQGHDRLVAGLARYRAIVAAGGWPTVPTEGGEVRLDGADPRLAHVRRRLSVEGDLPPGAPGDDRALLDAAVRRFQARHGLEPDGRIGAKTLAEMNVAAEQRVARIVANLARWRLLPRRLPETALTVNVAAAVLHLARDGEPVLEMRVVVGDPRHPTPVLASAITGLTLNPPWNIPPSIARREMLPRLRRDPLYLAKNDIVIVDREDDPHGVEIDWRRLPAGSFPFRLRQRPGAGNALGTMRFAVPNRFDVYLHDTPAKAAFKRDERGLSHGCVRLEQPADLALRLLAGTRWDAAGLADAVASGETRHIALARPMPVYLLYWTAFVDAAGLVNFRRDLYDRDRLHLAPPGAGRPVVAAAEPPAGGCAPTT